MRVELQYGTRIIEEDDVTEVLEDNTWITVKGKDWWHKFPKGTIHAISATDVKEEV